VVTRTGCQGGKSFEGYAPSGMGQPHHHSPRAAEERPQLKHGEPHGRLQGAIDLHGVERSKPSESGGTTRTERARKLALPSRREGLGRPGSGRTALISAEGRSLNPMRGVRTGPQSPRAQRRGKDRANRHAVFEGEARSRGRLVVVPTHQPTGNPHSMPRQRARSPTGKTKRPAGRPADSGEDEASAPTEPLTISDQANSRKAAPDCKERS
jgi:hypothetical protein